MRQETLKFFEEQNAQWLLAARAVATGAILEKGFVTADDIYKECPPPRYRKNVMGAVFKDSRFKPLGFTKSKRKEARGRIIRTWCLN